MISSCESICATKHILNIIKYLYYKTQAVNQFSVKSFLEPRNIKKAKLREISLKNNIKYYYSILGVASSLPHPTYLCDLSAILHLAGSFVSVSVYLTCKQLSSCRNIANRV